MSSKSYGQSSYHQCRAAVATLFLITFITNYNSYMWPESGDFDSRVLNLIATGIQCYFIAEGNYGVELVANYGGEHHLRYCLC
ncbi:hypothetical protein OK016_29915 [Vibrio chagasii]|nr:hypothetical protein [Vibrio chagasii]